jgi:hypothetical protein
MAGMAPFTSRAPYQFVAAYSVEGRQLSHVMEASCGRRKSGKMLTRSLAVVRYLYLVAVLVQQSSTNADEVVAQSTRIKPDMYRPLCNSHKEEMHSLDNDTSRLLQQKALATGTPSGEAPTVQLQDFSTTMKLAIAMMPIIAITSILGLMQQARGARLARGPDPPPWNPDAANSMPFRTWTQRLMVWGILGVDLDPSQQCAAIVDQRGGSARELADALSWQELSQGGAIGGQQLDPDTILPLSSQPTTHPTVKNKE